MTTTKVRLASVTLLFGAILSLGLLNKLFGQTPPKLDVSTSIEKNEYKEEFDFYFTNVDGKLSSIYVDLGLKRLVPVADKPNVVWVSMKMNSPRDDGLSSGEESNQLWGIEDKIVKELTSTGYSVYVGRLTSDGHRDLYFYVSDVVAVKRIISELIFCIQTTSSM